MSSYNPSSFVHTSVSTTLSLKVYPCGQHGYIGKYHHKDEPISSKPTTTRSSSQVPAGNKIQTVVILDRSFSMGQSVAKVVNQLLPQMLRALGYAEEDKVTIFAFDSQVLTLELHVRDLERHAIGCGGSTYLSYAIASFESWLHACDKRPIRLLTLSDGDVHDRAEAITRAKMAEQYIKHAGLMVNSQAIRLFTSSSQPDTQALASLLQLNTVRPGALLDLNANLPVEAMVASMSKLYENDGLQQCMSLESSEPLFLSTPWETTASNSLRVVPGDNTFWLKSIPNQITLSNNTGGASCLQYVVVEVQDQLNDVGKFHEILAAKTEYFMNQLGLLKVINTTDSLAQITKIVQYFKDLEDSLSVQDKDMQLLLSSGRLRGRVDFFKQKIAKNQRSVAQRMAEIANDNKVSQFNSAQSAQYLRTLDVSRNAKGLARRALSVGLDFTATAHKEVRAMAEHLSELDDVDDSTHNVSFYSQGTTLEGIKSVCELVTSDTLEEMEATDILQLLNIVGVPSKAPVGDFPDPITYRVNQMYPECYVSLSDVLMVHMASNGQTKLRTPGTDCEIDNVIPMFDTDSKVQRFMQKYCPSLLQYSASIGMRRVLAEVNLTYEYTLVAGVWALVGELNQQQPKSELSIRTWVQLVNSFQRSIGNYFHHTVGDIVTPADSSLSYYIAGDGVTKMISPLITILNDPAKNLFIPAILRSLYTYEVWQAIRRLYKHTLNPQEAANEILHRLIQLDLSQHRTALTPLFAPEPDRQQLKFYDQYQVSATVFEELNKATWYVNDISLLPTFLSVAVQGLQPGYDCVAEMRKIPQMNTQSICAAMNITYDFNTFLFFNQVQALQYIDTASRLDKDNKRMKMIDLVHHDAAKQQLHDYVRSKYVAQYELDCGLKAKQEESILCNDLVNNIFTCDDRVQLLNLFRNGIQRGTRSCVIVNRSSPGFIELQTHLLNTTKRGIPLHLMKLEFLLLGKELSTGEVVWNAGNVLMGANLPMYEAVFVAASKQAEWQVIRDYFKSNYRITYRSGAPNRHSHSNDKVSFYGQGYNTLEEFRAAISEADWMEYAKVHSECCGVARITQGPLTTEQRRAKKKAKKQLISHPRKPTVAASV